MPKLERFNSKGPEFWQGIRQDWRSASLDGCSAVKFCETRGLAYDTFNKYLAKWRKEALAAVQQVTARPGSTAQLVDLLPAPGPGKTRQGGKAGGSGLNAASPALPQPSPSRLLGSKPSTVEAQEAIEEAAAQAATNLVGAMQQAGPVGLKAALEVLDRSGVLRAKEAAKAAPYSEWSAEQLAARLAVLAPQVLPSTTPTTS